MRSTKVQYKIAPKVTPACAIRASNEVKAIMETHIPDFQAVCRVGEVKVIATGADAGPGSVVTPVNAEVDMCMILAGAVDAAAEIEKLNKAVNTKTLSKEKIEKEVADSDKYAKRPDHLKDADAKKLEDLTTELAQLALDIKSFEALSGGGYPARN